MVTREITMRLERFYKDREYRDRLKSAGHFSSERFELQDLQLGLQ
jgi:hypothetical protein